MSKLLQTAPANVIRNVEGLAVPIELFVDPALYDSAARKITLEKLERRIIELLREQRDALALPFVSWAAIRFRASRPCNPVLRGSGSVSDFFEGVPTGGAFPTAHLYTLCDFFDEYAEGLYACIWVPDEQLELVMDTNPESINPPGGCVGAVRKTGAVQIGDLFLYEVPSGQRLFELMFFGGAVTSADAYELLSQAIEEHLVENGVDVNALAELVAKLMTDTILASLLELPMTEVLAWHDDAMAAQKQGASHD